MSYLNQDMLYDQEPQVEERQLSSLGDLFAQKQ